MISSFYQYHSGCVFYCSRIARKAEAGRDGSPRSINKSAMCPAMWRLTFSGGGWLVRLSANGCQPHRPNTALIFCTAGYHPGLLLLSWLFYGNKNHASAMYWFKPLTFACHRIPEKNGHIKVITSAHATLMCPFSPGMG